MGPLIPLFWTSSDVSKPEWAALFELGEGVQDVHIFCIMSIGGSKRGDWNAPPVLWSNFFHFHAVFCKAFPKQESIPIGCVPTAL